MANAEHLEILKSGAEKWNEWRKISDIVNPDLSGANLSHNHLYRAEVPSVILSEANLSGVNLLRANLRGQLLSGANLSGANLSEANLSETNLVKANLSNTDLSKANLSGVDLSRANLSRANLSRADLSGSDLSSANMSEANLYIANLSSANLFEANLSKAKLLGTHLPGADLSGADLSRALLSEADLSNTYLCKADLSNADLSDADLSKADLSDANLSNTDLSRANFYRANLSFTDLSGAKLTEANLTQASFIKTILSNANIEGSKIFGISAWGIQKDGLLQMDLIITDEEEAEITVDNLEVAQFIYLMLNNQNIRDVIDTLTSKSVLILGRFSNTRKPLLDAIKDDLRKRNYLPILFDFEKPASRDLTETISILARMSRFVIADLTDAKSIPQELSHFVPDTFLPVVPIILQEQREYGMFEHFNRYDWVLPIYPYATPEAMLSGILENIIEPAERKVEELKRISK